VATSPIQTDDLSRLDEERWRQEQEVLRQAAAELAHNKATAAAATLSDLARLGPGDSLDLITRALDDPSPEVRTAAVRTLYDLNADLAASCLNNSLREGSHEQRRSLGAALTSSGLVKEAIHSLLGPHREKTYSALSLLFLVAKAGEIEPLMQIIEDHPSTELRLALIKQLGLSGEPKVLPAFYQLAQRGSLPPEIRSAIREAIFQFSNQSR
jgi:HEAT repeat protein